MLKNNKRDGRIFISYRRSDAKGYAGRLSDSLEDYFGNNRVFRDIEDIEGGAAFGEVIETNIKSADAVIVLIGPTWLSVTGKDNLPRLLAPGDWVAQEIASAIDLGIPLFPVLIEQTPMPRQEELPERLHPILQHNAITISDRTWQYDLLRLGRILSFDIPSENERKVNFIKKLISLSIFSPLAFTSSMLIFNFYTFIEEPFFNTSKQDSDVFDLMEKKGIYQGDYNLLQDWQTVPPVVGISLSLLLIFYIIPFIDKDRQKYLFYSIYTGAIGLFIILILLWPIHDIYEETFIYSGSIIVAIGMLAFMNISGFKVK
ncbi:MAG: toll/interleukin-1 receptor domain-containing protein [Saprospiraceae bacterium]